MGISAVIAIGVPVLLFFIFRKRFGLRVVPVLVGVAAFIVFALILEQLLHLIVLRPDAGGKIALMSSNPLLYVLYGIFAAGVFEETARLVSLSLLKKKYTGIGTGLSYGIGHGGIESVLLLGVTMISNLAVSIMVNTGAAGALPEQIRTQIPLLAGTSPFMFLVGGFERLSAIAIQISLSLLVWYAVSRKGKLWLFPLAIILHAAADLPAGLAQVGFMKNVILVEIWVAAYAVILLVSVIFTCKKLNNTNGGNHELY